MSIIGNDAPQIIIDATHCGGRNVTGLERITLELFSKEALAPLDIRLVTAGSKFQMALRQNISIPFQALANKQSLVLTPGFPPAYLTTSLGQRAIPYIHDLFLLTRWQDLSLTARLYMSGPFWLAVKRLPRFMVNSETTGSELRNFCRADAEIILYRPEVRNVFELSPRQVGASAPSMAAPRLVAIGTVEPRKNLIAAAAVISTLRRTGFPGATLDVLGRIGWGPDAERLEKMPGVTLHGYRSMAEIKAIVEASDAYLSTSHDEGIGLPLLETQYAGLPVIAPDKRVFHEVLGESGTFIDTKDSNGSAAAIAALFAEPDWRDKYRKLSLENVERWNAAARMDRAKIIALLTSLSLDAG